MAKNLLYKPNLGYNKNYYTEGEFNTPDFETAEEHVSNQTLQDQMHELEAEVEKYLPLLPEMFISTYIPSYYGMKDEYDRLTGELNNDNDDETVDEEDDDNNGGDGSDDKLDIGTEDDKGDDNTFPPLFEDNDNLDLTKGEKVEDPIKILKDKYYFDFTEIYKDYLEKMVNKLEFNFISSLQAMGTGLMNDTIDSYNTTDIKNKNLKHLSDYIIKANVSMDQVMRLHKKLYHIDEMILHIRNIRVSYEQMIRYADINLLEQENFLEVDSNVLLKESRLVAEKKYEENLYSLYKYLNSSVILLDESLKGMYKQTKAMMTINKHEERD